MYRCHWVLSIIHIYHAKTVPYLSDFFRLNNLVIQQCPGTALTFVRMYSSAKREEAFNRLYNLTRDPVYHYLRHYTADTHLIEDLMQQAYLKVWERLDKIRDIDDAVPLIKTYTRNLLVDVIRKRLKEDVQWLETLKKEVEGIVEPSGPLESRQQLQVLDIAIDRLPEKCKQVYLFHREQGLSYQEIATRLSISVSMVEKYMSKAIRFLKQDLLTDPTLLLVVVALSINEFTY